MEKKRNRCGTRPLHVGSTYVKLVERIRPQAVMVECRSQTFDVLLDGQHGLVHGLYCDACLFTILYRCVNIGLCRFQLVDELRTVAFGGRIIAVEKWNVVNLSEF